MKFLSILFVLIFFYLIGKIALKKITPLFIALLRLLIDKFLPTLN